MGECSVSLTVGFLSIAGAVLFFGTFAAPTKTKRIMSAEVEPFFIAQIVNVTIFITSWLPVAWEGWFFSYWGLVGAALWTPANLLALMAVRLISLSVAQGIWSGASIIVSFMWGALYLHQPLRSLGGAIGALLLLLLFIFGISMCKPDEVATPPKKLLLQGGLADSPESEEDQGDAKQTDGNSVNSAESASLLTSHQAATAEAEDSRSASSTSLLRRIMGFSFCIFTGLLNGSMMVPANQLSADEKNLGYMPSFGIGVLLVTVIQSSVYFGLIKRALPSKAHMQIALIPGVLAGLCWNIGNAFSLLASLSPLGLTIGFPLTQCSLLVGGAWGFFYFKEMSGWRKTTQYFVCGVGLIGAAYMLSYFGRDTTDSTSNC